MPNRLAQETSPYLLQHKDNPVDWYPWGPEALATSKSADKPIFLSVGYAACHWCHVMAHESFEDPETATYLNGHFVPIKVDREERPDIDALYMESVQAMTGHGGWPMSVFLTPDGKPFYGGTYFPNTPRYGMPSFRRVLEGVAEAWSERRAEIEESGTRVAATIADEQRSSRPAQASPAAKARGGGPATPTAITAATTNATALTATAPTATAPTATAAVLDPSVLDAAIARLADAFDWTHGSWGGAPKFPQAMTLEFVLRRITGSEDQTPRTAADGSDLDPERARLLRMATKTLDAMADGGIRDQLGGGFHRYSTDEVWLVPHFEKMLYDNAQLARVYLHAWQLTGESRYREVVESTLDYVAREMTLPEGGFAASQDADSPDEHGHPEEGAFYVWRMANVEAVLGDDAPLFATAYEVRSIGNWEGKTILRRVRTDAELEALFASPDSAAGADAPAQAAAPAGGIAERLARARANLLRVRDERARPARDDKALASWNGLMLAAFAEAARALDRPDYLDVAERNAAFVLANLRADEGRLRRSWKDGRATLNGYLEDYANVAEGLLALYETTFDPRWFAAARDLADQMLAHFADPDGGFFDTSDDHETLVARPKGLQDNAVPSGNAMAATVLLKLAAYSGGGRYRDAAEDALAIAAPHLGRYPTGFAQWLTALDAAVAPVREISILTAADARAQASEVDRLVAIVRAGYRPHQVVALGAADGADDVRPPLLVDRVLVDGKPTAYVCRGFACDLPVTDPQQLARQLGQPIAG